MRLGDVVELKSGGPAMTIKSRGEETAVCIWNSWARVEGSGICEYAFPIVCLKPYVEPANGSGVALDLMVNHTAVQP